MVKAISLRIFGKILGDSTGVTSLEYAVLAVFVVGAVLTAASTLGGDIKAALTTIGGSL